MLDALARHARVALLVVGDPFAATTHVALRLAAERAGHTWHYVPNASILTAAAGYLGLMHYRFGRTVSVPLPEPGFAPRSMIDQISGNLDRGLHTLVLLDLRPGEGRYLTAPEALRTLSERDPDHVVLRPESPWRWPPASGAIRPPAGTGRSASWSTRSSVHRSTRS